MVVLADPKAHGVVPGGGRGLFGFAMSDECHSLAGLHVVYRHGVDGGLYGRVVIYDLATSQVVRETTLFDPGPFFQLGLDRRGDRLYAPIFLLGEIVVLDLATLEERQRIPADIGVRGVLLDPDDPDRVLSWNYVTGRVIEHRLPAGTASRSWTLGPLLRTLNWDCGGGAALAATAEGVFRVHLEGGPGRVPILAAP